MNPPLGTDVLPKEPTHKGDRDCMLLYIDCMLLYIGCVLLSSLQLVFFLLSQTGVMKQLRTLCWACSVMGSTSVNHCVHLQVPGLKNNRDHQEVLRIHLQNLMQKIYMKSSASSVPNGLFTLHANGTVFGTGY